MWEVSMNILSLKTLSLLSIWLKLYLRKQCFMSWMHQDADDASLWSATEMNYTQNSIWKISCGWVQGGDTAERPTMVHAPVKQAKPEMNGQRRGPRKQTVPEQPVWSSVETDESWWDRLAKRRHLRTYLREKRNNLNLDSIIIIIIS